MTQRIFSERSAGNRRSRRLSGRGLAAMLPLSLLLLPALMAATGG